MDCGEIKRYIYENDKIIDILESLNCHHIKEQNEYITFGMPDGDNPQSTVLYKDIYLPVIAYTRDIKDKNGHSDIISLVAFITQDKMLSHNIKYLCDIIGIDYYYDYDNDIPESIKFTQWLVDNNIHKTKIEKKLQPISEKILTYYYNIPNKKFYDDGINIATQKEFEIGFDIMEQVITIPIRDDLGNLVGVKGRTILNDTENKYWYLEKCAKSHILYGLYQTYPYIIEKSEVIIVESEKSVMKLWQAGYKNAVAIACHSISKIQVEKLSRLAIDEIIICYDEDVFRKENGIVSKQEYLQEAQKFLKQQKVTAMIDIRKQLLNDKESPADNIKKFKYMYKRRFRLQ